MCLVLYEQFDFCTLREQVVKIVEVKNTGKVQSSFCSSGP